MVDCSVHKLVADVALVSNDRVLLVKYRDTSKYDGQRGWFLPDDFLEHEEHPDDAAGRIADEQAGIVAAEPALGFIESFGNGAWHLIFHYRADVPEPMPIEPAGNVAEAEWFSLDRLPSEEELAHHGWAADVLERLGVRST